MTKQHTDNRQTLLKPVTKSDMTFEQLISFMTALKISPTPTLVLIAANLVMVGLMIWMIL